VITAFVGYDPREAAAYHVFCQSVIEHASVPVRFVPLHRPMLQNFDGQRDGSNAFIFSRFLIPELMNFANEWVAFFDGDMVMREDIATLWAQRSVNKALMVVPHAYETAHPRKYIGTPLESINVDYPRKNQSSVMLWNCGHYAHRILTRQFLEEAGGAFLHRFQWLRDDQIGHLGDEWNRLIGEQESDGAKLLHYTLGVPGFTHYRDCDGAAQWHQTLTRALRIEGRSPPDMVADAFNRS
jgi:hypothetical protein